MNKKYFSNNCIKYRSYYNSKYMIINNDYKLYSIYEYNKDSNDYKLLKSSFNVYSFIEFLKDNKYKKYFSFNDNELIKD